MVIVWNKGTTLRMWHCNGGISIPKEKNIVTIEQFRPLSLLNVEGNTFFSVEARVYYLKANTLIDVSVQTAGVPGFSGCLEHRSMIWHQLCMGKVFWSYQ